MSVKTFVIVMYHMCRSRWNKLNIYVQDISSFAALSSDMLIRHQEWHQPIKILLQQSLTEIYTDHQLIQRKLENDVETAVALYVCVQEGANRD